MDDHLLFSVALASAFLAAIPIFLGLLHLTAPYGRHSLSSYGFLLPTRLAWSLMESPAFFLTLLLLPLGQHRSQLAPTILALFFLAHYFHRVIIYPLRIRPSTARNMPLSIAALSFLFNAYNAYLQARSLSHYTAYPSSWLFSVQFAVGALMFVAGMAANIWADHVLVSLRKDPADRAYKIPRGGLFEYVTCPNYFGEMVEWLGWVIMTWSAAGLAFFLLTAANLTPRAVAHHKWYLKNFPNYPRSRRILIPFIY